MRRGDRLGDGRDAQFSASELRVVDTRERVEENESVLYSVCDYEYGRRVSGDGFEIYGTKLFHRGGVRDGNFCMMNAMDHIRNGECDLCLAGASDAAVLSSGIAGFAASKALSTRNDDPEGASRPWDKNRDGFVMGEGCGVLCLESLESALARDAPILAEILGGAATCDAHHMTEPLPNGAGVRLAIGRALKNAGVLAEDVNYINAHATSTPAGDLAELRTITDIFGENSELKINSTKSLIGHLLGAASAVEAVAVIKAIGTGELHPNKNLEDPDEGVRTDLLVGTTKEKLKVKVALSNSFGFGGHNSAVLFAAYDAKADTFCRAASA